MYKSKNIHNRFVSIMLILCFVFASTVYMFPVYAVDTELSNGTISAGPIEELQPIGEVFSLNESDVPEFMSFSELKNKGHVYRLRENEENMNTAAFLNSDGTITQYTFPVPIKYKNNDGIVKDKSTALTANGTDLVMADNDINVTFPQSMSQGVSVAKDGIKISMVPNFASASTRTVAKNSKAAINNKAVYLNAFGNGIHLQYTATISGVKEDIILDSYTGTNQFAFIINTNGLYPVKNANGSCTFYDPSTDNAVAEMMQVYCIDAAGKFAGGDITITQLKQNQKYIFTVIPETGFLEDENTVYPVTIDPTITMNTQTAVEDTIIYSGRPTRNYGDHKYATIGYLDDTYKTGNYMVKFPTLADNTYYQSSEVTSAYFHIYTASGGNAASSIRTYTYKSDWEEGTMTWNDYAFSNTSVFLNTTTVPSGGTQKMSINVTNAAKNWADGTDDPNKGLILFNFYSSSSYARDFLTVEYAVSTNTAYMPYLEINVTTEDQIILVSIPSSMKAGANFTCEFYLISGGSMRKFSEYTYLFNVVSSNDNVITYDEATSQLKAVNAGTARITVSEAIYIITPISTYFDVTVIPNINISAIPAHTLNHETNNSFDIGAYLITDGVAGSADTGITYIKGSNSNNIPYTLSTTGKVQLTTVDSGLAHKTGKFTVRARSNKYPNQVYKDIEFTVNCTYSSVSENSTTGIYLKGGRYISIDHSDIAINNSSELENLVDSQGLGDVENFIDIDCEFKDDWLVYEQDMGAYDRNKQLFQLIGNSRIACVVTHGDDDGNLIMSGTDDSVIFNASDIQALHDNYFSKCYLVIYTACNSAEVAEATKSKGAKVSIGFTVEIDENLARCFEYTVLSLLRYDESYYWDPNGNIEVSSTNNMTIQNAVTAAIEFLEIPEDYVDIYSYGNCKDKTITELEWMYS